MFPLIHQFKLRLTNLNQRNRSLRLSRLSPRRDLDLQQASFSDGEPAMRMLEKVMTGKAVTLLKGLSARDASLNLLDRRLNQIHREITTIHEETGAYELYLGYPFAEGRFLDGTLVRCPVMLFPVQLRRNVQGSPRWQLEIPENAEVQPNKTFFLAWEKFQQQRLRREFWEEEYPDFGDVQDFLNYLYRFLQGHELELNFNQDLFRQELEPFADYSAAFMETWETGKVRFRSQAVLGIFPQSDSALLQDYEALERDAEACGLAELLDPVIPELRPVPEMQRNFITPVDQSQEEALLRVRSGQSVVIHGPPGTGKSQVILNLIADAVAQGKRVLVCSQKRAALDVIATRLREQGLGAFAAQVHDHRKDRPQVYQALRQQILNIEQYQEAFRDLNLTRREHEFRQEAARLEEGFRFFDTLCAAQTDRSAWGLSAYELCLLIRPGEQPPPPGPWAHQLNHTRLEALLRQLEAILDYREYLDPAHPWALRHSLAHLEPAGREPLLAFTASIGPALERIHTQAQALAPLHPLPDPETAAAWIQAWETLALPLTDPQNVSLHTTLAQTPAADHAKILRSLCKHCESLEKHSLLTRFPWNLLPDLRQHLTAYTARPTGLGRWLSLEWLRARWYLQRVLGADAMKQGGKPLLQALDKELRQREKLVKASTALEPHPFWKDAPLTDTPQTLRSWLDVRARTLEQAQAATAAPMPPVLKPRWTPAGLDTAAWAQAQAQIQGLRVLMDSLRTLRQHLLSRLPEARVQELLAQPEANAPARDLAARMAATLPQSLPGLQALDKLLARLDSTGKDALADYGDHLAQQEAPAGLEMLRQAVYRSWLANLEKRHPELEEVTLRGFPRRREQLQQGMRSRMQQCVDGVTRKLQAQILDNIEHNRLRNPVTYRDLLHQVSKKRQVWPLRKLVHTYWEEEISRLIPCWLASPEAVSALFPMQQGVFDLVIFDEASQCYVERSLPVCLRGSTRVVAGDDKQLPPFDLYSVRLEEEESLFFESEKALEADSLLALAQRIFPEARLSWHYRSSHADLIRFSNALFYENRLRMTPPPVPDARWLPAVEWVYVPEGAWEQNRNLPEARAVVARVLELLAAPQPPSLGIVTFNYPQQELLRDLLDQAQQPGAGVAAEVRERLMSLRNAEDEHSLFVKNIENVQGDERDVILFSVGYARNEKGRVAAQFGLLNQAGGENRLNVAVTRARHKVYVYTSFEPEALEVAGLTSAGPALLRQYLLYARAVTRDERKEMWQILGGEPELASPVLPGFRELAAQVATALQDRGVDLVVNAGEWGNRMDIVIRREGKPVLAVECEGANYYAGKTAREREVYKPQSWARMGWKMHRVHARNFFLDPEAEISAILKAAGLSS